MLVGAYVVQSRGVVDLEPLAASVPIGLLVAMILYVNEIPDRRSDARAESGPCPCDSAVSPSCAGSSSRSAPRMPHDRGRCARRGPSGHGPAILLTIPLARRVHDGLRPNYDNPLHAHGRDGHEHPAHALAGALLFLAYRGRARRRRHRPVGPALRAVAATLTRRRRGSEREDAAGRVAHGVPVARAGAALAGAELDLLELALHRVVGSAGARRSGRPRGSPEASPGPSAPPVPSLPSVPSDGPGWPGPSIGLAAW